MSDWVLCVIVHLDIAIVGNVCYSFINFVRATYMHSNQCRDGGGSQDCFATAFLHMGTTYNLMLCICLAELALQSFMLLARDALNIYELFLL